MVVTLAATQISITILLFSNSKGFLVLTEQFDLFTLQHSFFVLFLIRQLGWPNM